jgi:hypothetical protein
MKKMIVTFFTIIMVTVFGEHNVSSSNSELSNPQQQMVSSQWQEKIMNGYIKVKWRHLGNGTFELKFSKRKIIQDAWTEYDNFKISMKNPKHHYVGNLYPTVSADYWIELDFKKLTARSRGTVYQKIMKQEHKWDEDLSTFTFGKIVKLEENGYNFVQTSDEWGILCSSIPCGPWVTFPGYSQKDIHRVKIDGIKEELIIQLWKGFCPRFLDITTLQAMKQSPNTPKPLADIITAALKANQSIDYKKNHFGDAFPGGYGAEVGIYIKKQGHDENYFWWPYVKGKLKIKFQLINPITKEVFIDAPEDETWWRTKWMATDSYLEYKKTHQCPENPLAYELVFWINGKKYESWPESNWP